MKELIASEDLRLIEPMLAGSIKAPVFLAQTDMLERQNQWVVEEKHDGNRVLLYFHDQGIAIVTRNGKDISEKMPQVSQVYVPKLEGTVLDAEVMPPVELGLDAVRQIRAITGATPENAVAWQKEHGWARFICFDLMRMPTFIDVTSFAQKDRRGLLAAIVYGDLVEVPGLELSVLYRDNFADIFHMIVNRGGEGIILKNTEAPYVPGGRDPKIWAKVKRHATWDFVIIDFTEGLGKYSDTVGAIVYGYYDHDAGVWQRVGQCSGMTDLQRYSLTQSDIGRVIEITGQEQSKDTLAVRHPQFAQFRDDLDPLAIGPDGRAR